MEVMEVVTLHEHNLITTRESREILGFGEHDALADRVERVKVELRDALTRKGGAVEWRDGITRALEILA